MDFKRAARLCTTAFGAISCLIVLIFIGVIVYDLYAGEPLIGEDDTSVPFSSTDFETDLDRKMSKAKAAMKGMVESEPTKSPIEREEEPPLLHRLRRHSSDESIRCCWPRPSRRVVNDEGLALMIAHGNQLLSFIRTAKEKERQAPVQYAELIKVVHAINDELAHVTGAKRVF